MRVNQEREMVQEKPWKTHLVDRRNDGADPGDDLEVLDPEVADTNRPSLAFTLESCQTERG